MLRPYYTSSRTAFSKADHQTNPEAMETKAKKDDTATTSKQAEAAEGELISTAQGGRPFYQAPQFKFKMTTKNKRGAAAAVAEGVAQGKALPKKGWTAVEPLEHQESKASKEQLEQKTEELSPALGEANIFGARKLSESDPYYTLDIKSARAEAQRQIGRSFHHSRKPLLESRECSEFQAGTKKQKTEGLEDLDSASGEEEEPWHLFEGHVPAEELVMTSSHVEGRLKADPNNFKVAWVEADSIPVDILIPNFNWVNRAMDGDTVIVELVDSGKWIPEQRKEHGDRTNLLLHTAKGVKTNPIGHTNLKEWFLSKSKNPPPRQVEPKPEAVAESSSTDDGSSADLTSKAQTVGKHLCPIGRVIALKAARWRDKDFLCTVTLMEKTKAARIDGKKMKQVVGPPEFIAKPFNPKLPWFSPVLSSEQEDEVETKPQVWICSFKSWEANALRPRCRLLKQVTKEAGNLSLEKRRLLEQYGISEEPLGDDLVGSEFSPSSDQSNDQLEEWTIPDSEVQKRADLRELRTFTIDPLTARDLDDALSIRVLSPNLVEVGIHIADVSFFVTNESSLDKEAYLRGTSAYFVDGVHPMLPRRLCEKLCSLNPGVDRLAVTCFATLRRETGELQGEPRFTKSVIRSRAKWTYEFVQALLQGSVDVPDKEGLSEEMTQQAACHDDFSELVEDCRLLRDLSQKRRLARLARGAMVFRNQEFSFELDEATNLPTSSKASASCSEAKQLVEEFMLLANVSAAKFLMKKCPDLTVLRAHSDFTESKKEDLEGYLHKLNIKGIDLTNALSLSKSLECLPEVERTGLQRKLLACLSQATYVPVDEDDDEEDRRHYGLNFDLYTHFTSPIRRYADLYVHLLISFFLDNLEGGSPPARSAERVAAACSERGLACRKAGRESVKLYHCLLLKQRGGHLACDCQIFDIDKNNLSIFIEELNLPARIHLRDDPRFKDSQLFLSYAGTKEKRKANFRSIFIFKEEQYLGPGYVSQRQWRERNVFNEEDVSEDEPEGDVSVTVFDTVKVLVEVTETFPIDIRCKLLCTVNDLDIYQRLKERQSQA